MGIPQVLKLNLSDHWVLKEHMPGDGPLPASVIARWSYFTRQARRSRNGHYFGEIFSLILSGTVPIAAILTGSATLAAVLGSVAVILNGMRPLFAFREEYISASQARYEIERVILTHTQGDESRGPDARVRLIMAVENIAAEEGQRFTQRRERASKALADANRESTLPGPS